MTTLLLAAASASGGQKDWFAWTNDAGDFDYQNLLNWRWANSANMPSGVTAFGHPASLTQLKAARTEVGRATTGTPLPQRADINGATVAMTYGSMEIDSGMDLNIYNGGVMSVTGAVSANGLGTDPVKDFADGVADWTGNHLQTNIHVSGGGRFTATGGLTGSIAALGYVGNLGLYAQGWANFSAASYAIGASSNVGGGHLTIQGYDSRSSLAVTGACDARPAAASADPTTGSSPARFEIILDASNQGGQINTLSVGSYLNIQSPDAARPSAVQVNVTLAGYTPTPGQIFQVISAPQLRNGGTIGSVGTIDKGWNNAFALGTGTARLLSACDVNHDGTTEYGLFLEVLGGAPRTPGDANEDGLVDAKDYSTLKQHFRASGGTWGTGDFSGDGRVYMEDVQALRAHYGQGSGAPGSGQAGGGLSLRVDPATLQVWLTNTSGQAVTFDNYEIWSASGKLNPAAWKSIESAASSNPGGVWTGLGAGGASFDDLTSGTGLLAEGNLTAGGTLAAGASWNLGAALTVLAGGDLSFFYTLAGTSGVKYTGDVIVSALVGETNGDGLVDLQDFGTLKACFGTTAGATWREGDFNGDGAVDLQDFSLFKNHMGEGGPGTVIAGAAVPEPAGGLVLLAAAGLIRRRNRTGGCR